MSGFPDYDFSPYLVSLGRNWMQALDDLVRFQVGGREEEFLAQVWPTGEIPGALPSTLREVLAEPASEKNVLRFRGFAHDYYTAYQVAALSHYR